MIVKYEIGPNDSTLINYTFMIIPQNVGLGFICPKMSRMYDICVESHQLKLEMSFVPLFSSAVAAGALNVSRLRLLWPS